MKIHQLAIDQIDIDDRFRKDPAEGIEELMESIRAHGLLQPIVCTIVGGKEKLLCGRRRLEAHFRLAKEDPRFLTITAVMKEDMDELQRRIVELEENLKRLDFNDLEKVKGVNEVHRLFQQKNPGWGLEQTANYLGLGNKSWVSRILTVARAVEERPEGEITKILASGFSTGGRQGNITRAYKEIKKQDIQTATAMLEKILSTNAINQKNAGVEGAESRAEGIIKFGDCLSLAPGLANESIHLLHTDPPYGINFDILEKGDTKSEMYKDDSLEASTNLWKALAPELYRILRRDAYGIIWVSFVQLPIIRGFMESAGFECGRKPFIWVKTGGPWAAYAPSRWFASAYDSALIFAKGSPVLVKQGEPDFIEYPPLQPSEKTHPLERPIGLLGALMSRFLVAGQTVFDPFAGSGSTAMASIKLGAKPITFEKDPGFYNQAKLNIVRTIREVS